MSLEWILQQGGLLTVCGMLVWLLREQGRRTQQTADAYMRFGAEYAEALTKVTEGLARQGMILDHIEQHLRANHVCPVTQVTSQMLREGMEAPDGGRRRVDTILRTALKEAVKGAHLSAPEEER